MIEKISLLIALFACCILIASSEKHHICSDEEYGSIRPNVNDCSKYYRCEKKLYSELEYNWINEECPPYQYFDWKINNCIPNYNNCEAALSAPYVHCKSGDSQEDPSNFKQYFNCLNDEWIIKTCPINNIYNVTAKKCMIEPKCQHGLMREDASNCAKYFLCNENADWISMHCEPNMYFNMRKNKCILDSFNVCDQISVEIKTTTRDTRSTLEFVGKCIETTIKPDIKECSRYFICKNNAWHLKICPDKEYFDIFSLECRFDHDNKCKKESEEINNKNKELNLTLKKTIKHICIEGEFTYNPDNCRTYFVCKNQKWVPTHCDNEMYFDRFKNTCVPDDGSCFSENSDDKNIKLNIDGNCTEGLIKEDILDCTRYYLCKNNTWVTEKCNSMLYFNNVENKCIINNGTCHTDGQANKEIESSVKELYGDCNEKETKADIFDCDRFYLCKNNTWVAFACGKNTYYNSEKMKCVLDDGTCHKEKKPEISTDSNQIQCNHGETKIDDISCNRYYFCKENNIWQLLECPKNYYFNVTNKYCLPNTENCIPTVLNSKNAECTEGTYKLNNKISNQYFECVNTNWILKTCKNDYIFDIITKKCELRNSANVIEMKDKQPALNYKKSCDDGESKPNDGNTITYYVCKDGKWKLKSCPNGFIFESKTFSCVPHKI